MTEKIFIYLRVSTQQQADKNTEEGQKNAIIRFLKDKDVKIIAEFQDLGKQGDDPEREQFNSMQKRLHEVDGIAVFDIDRLSRDLSIGMDLMKGLMTNHVKIYEARTQTIKDLSQDTDQLMYLIGMWANSTEKKKIKARQKEGIARYREKNEKWGASQFWGKDLKGKKMAREQFISEYKRMIGLKNSKRQIARNFSMHIQTLYKRIYQCGLEHEKCIN